MNKSNYKDMIILILLMIYSFLTLINLIDIIHIRDYTLSLLCTIVYFFNNQDYWEKRKAKKKLKLLEEVNCFLITFSPWLILISLSLVEFYTDDFTKFLYEIYNILICCAVLFFIKKRKLLEKESGGSHEFI